MSESARVSEAPPTVSNHPRIAALDGIRGLAILVVLFHHGVLFAARKAVTPGQEWIHRLAEECWVGVDLFFVLSGYLITRILLQARGRPHYFKNFYVRRTLRIFPLYYGFIFAFCFALPLLLPSRTYLAELWNHQLWYWFYVPGVAIFRHGDWYVPVVDHTWSLAIEEQFYLVWPLVVALLSRRRIIGVGASVFFVCLALRIGMATHGYSNAQIRVFTPAHCDGLMLGGVLSALEMEGLSTKSMRRLAVAAVAAGVALRIFAGTPFVGAKVAWDAIDSSAFALVFVGAIAATLGWPSSVWTRFLSTRWLGFFGTYSYGIYLFHQPLLVLFSPILGRRPALSATVIGNWGANLALIGGVSVILAYASYHLFESRFLALKARFT